MRPFAALLFYLFFLSNALAYFSDLHVGMGLLDQWVGRFQTEKGGSTNKFDYQLFINAGVRWDFPHNFSFIPEASLVKPGHPEDEQISQINYSLNTNFAYMLENPFGGKESSLDLRLGTGINFNYISGDGGTKALPNGSGTANFFVPEGASTTRNVTLNVGAEYFFLREWSARVETQVFNVFNSRNRAFSYTLSGHYHLGDQLWD